MEKLRKTRTPIRAQVKRLANTINDLLNAETVDEITLQVKLEGLQENYKKLEEFDSKVLELLLKDDQVTDEDQDVEYQVIEEYREVYSKARIKVESYFENKRKVHDGSSSESVVTSSSASAA